jgi:hypothetical protein
VERVEQNAVAGGCVTPPARRTAVSHFVIWIDSNEARIFAFGKDSVTESSVHSKRQDHVHRHPKDGLTRAHEHPNDDGRFFDDVRLALKGPGRILIVGPGVAKLHFLRHAQLHEPALEARVAGIETVDHPTDRQIVAYARQYFARELTSAP